jgi:transposase
MAGDRGEADRDRLRSCGVEIDRDLNAARNLKALVETTVAGSGSETLNARPSTQVRPGLAGRTVGREPGSRERRNTGTASEQSKAA